METSVKQIQVFMGDNDEGYEGWYWRAVAGNNQIVAVSGEGFTRKEDAIRAAEDVFPGVEIVWNRMWERG